jgi:hypothetical protein
MCQDAGPRIEPASAAQDVVIPSFCRKDLNGLRFSRLRELAAGPARRTRFALFRQIVLSG